ncbi:LacI family DNA-binding transcriptional regulator [Streptomyces sp. ME19-01-6]|uniref:LacI family DNA-binding transcriptional regulator n=1 Tax=Streptomyces sp. ME19-01-6 TaxID=3028686 RepID=UPI0029BD520F|nr:LacI family DNA-binding transcriptional regulator [Streptomyces sp. ME19-01-6]MDX3232908.1 LacI family DNA-binding transcriptional regulator [Streptomyces sp. ME19-01-6]
MSERKPQSVRQLDALVDQLAAGVSANRAKQLRMVAGMWGRAVGREGMPVRAGRSVGQLFTTPALKAFWGLAAAGELRHRAEDVGKPLPLATQRIVRDCLGILAEAAVPGREVWLPALDNVPPRPTVTPAEQAVLYRKLADMAASGPLARDGTGLSFEDRTRLLAMVAIVLDCGARSGELAAMRLDDLGKGMETIAVRRRPQKGRGQRRDEIAALVGVSPVTVSEVLAGRPRRIPAATQRAVLDAADALGPAPGVETYRLREGTRVAVRRWLAVRDGLVADLEGEKTALWVSLRARGMSRGGVERSWPEGVPLGAEGVRLAYGRGMVALNVLMAGEWGWSPMPEKLEQLRRSVLVEPIEA